MLRLFRILTLVVMLTLYHTSPAQGDALPDSAYITGVIGHAQGYSLSCESRSAADFAAFWDVYIGETEFLQALPQSDNPNEGFVGYSNDAWGSIPPYGYGVHADPVAETLQEFGLQADARDGLSWDDLRVEISNGRPVIVWVVGQMWSGTPVEYEASDGSTVTVAAYEHTMILTGYSTEAVQVVDAYSGEYQSYWLQTFLKSWGVLGNMAVFGPGEVGNNTEEPELQLSGGNYTVQAGDYLVALAERFGTTWQELAELNSIPYPWTIFTGQVLQVPGAEAADEVPAEEPEAAPEVQNEPKAESPTPTPSVDELTYQAVLPVVVRDYVDPIVPTISMTSTVESLAATVIVIHADTLLNFGHDVGVDWRLLAKLNDLHPPYIVHPGQVLKLK